MASVDRNTINLVGSTTGLLAGEGEGPFDREVVFTADTWPVFDFQSPFFRQDLDAAYGRGINGGRGVVGEGGDAGPGVVGIAGGSISKNFPKELPRPLSESPMPGRRLRVGVFGTGRMWPAKDVGTKGVGGAIGVSGDSDSSAGVFGFSDAHCGVYGASGVTGVIGDGSKGHIGVEGICGDLYGVYGHVNLAKPGADQIGVFGAAGLASDFKTSVGRAGVFVGPVDVVGDAKVTGDLVVWGTKSAAVEHADGSHRLLYCIESPENQLEDFGEAKLAKGRAKVRIDPDFASVADLRGYHVFLTPNGDSRGLYVAVRHRNDFEVREQAGGTSSVSFSYRIVAKRKGVTVKRFKKVRRPLSPTPPTALAPPNLDVPPQTPARGAGRTAKRKA
jgi:hypothetical protein